MVALTSAGGLLALLDESDSQIKSFALSKLNEVVDEFWSEIAPASSKLEVLFEDKSFSHRELASLVASKIYFHLGALDTSLTYALGAGTHFDVFTKSEFVEAIVAYGIDLYIKLNNQLANGENVTIDPRLEVIVDRMFQRSFADGQFKHVLGIAIESHRVDMVRESIVTSGNMAAMLSYALDICLNVVPNKDFRNRVLWILVELHRGMPTLDYEAICRCLVYLDDAEGVAEVLSGLIVSSNEFSHQIALQLAFELYENATQRFLRRVIAGLPQSGASPAVTARIETTLLGENTIPLFLEFLFRKKQGDPSILKTTKTVIESRSSVLHSAIVFSNAIMNAGTTSDVFLRENLEWLARATNWSKFAAVGTLGVIHRGHISQARALLKPYLPRETGASGSQYSEGGALFALGLIHANHGKGVMEDLINGLKNNKETVQHGAALGLGLAAMGTGDNVAYEALRNVLFTDSAVAGEAAGLAMGLVMMSTANHEAVTDMLTYAHETTHDKIIRGLAVGIALIMYGAEQEADTLIEQLLADKDPLLRYSGMYTIAMAYAGTARTSAVRRLLHVAVSDVSDDVRRAAVTSLGFLLFGTPEACPPMVQLLAESFNPHVRYGATLALGIACAGTGLNEALDILEPLTMDSVDFVRQGAMIALGMVLIQHNEAMSPRVGKVRKLYEKVIADKHEDIMAKFGAIVGQGIIDAGGRNVTISLRSRSGTARAPCVVGLLCFTQYWYWFPLLNMISLAFTPTATILLNKDLQMPQVEFVSRIRPSAFAYPPLAPPPTSEKVEKVATAVLSTTAKAKARATRTKDKRGDAMDVEETAASSAAPTPAPVAAAAASAATSTTTAAASTTTAAASTTTTAAAAPAKEEEEKKKPVKEPSSEVVVNPARVLPQQQKYMSMGPNPRYLPIKSDLASIVVVRDTTPDKPETLISFVKAVGVAPPETEPGPPPPFEYEW